MEFGKGMITYKFFVQVRKELIKPWAFTYWGISRTCFMIRMWKKKISWKVHLVPYHHSIWLWNYTTQFMKHLPSSEWLLLHLVVNRKEAQNMMSPDTLLALCLYKVLFCLLWQLYFFPERHCSCRLGSLFSIPPWNVKGTDQRKRRPTRKFSSVK